MFSRAVLCLLTVFAVVHAATQVGVNNRVDGDQTVGGVHLFELHTPQGGIGLGFKIILILIIVGAVIYWYIRRRTQMAIRRHPALQQIATAASAYAPYAPPLTATALDLAAVHPSSPVVCPAPSAHHAPATTADAASYRMPK